MQKTLTEFVSEFVDDQIGLDCASCCTTFNDTNISIFSKGSMSEGEWEEMADELIESLNRQGYGDWELTGRGTKGCRLMIAH